MATGTALHHVRGFGPQAFLVVGVLVAFMIAGLAFQVAGGAVATFLR